jgi:hypothetical protein
MGIPNLEFRPLQNSEDLHMPYIARRLVNDVKMSSVLTPCYCY